MILKSLRTFVWSSTINRTWQMAFTDATTEQFLCVPWCRREAIYQSASCPAKCCPAAAGSSRWPLASWRRRRPGTQGMVFGIYLLWCEASKIFSMNHYYAGSRMLSGKGDKNHLYRLKIGHIGDLRFRTVHSIHPSFFSLYWFFKYQ